jgi:hypothetical protein
MSTYRWILRAADNNFPHWVALPEDECTGQNFHKLRKFCGDRKLSLSRHGHSVTRRREYYQVFMFADEEHAEVFRKEFGGEPMHPSERGKGEELGLNGKEAHISRNPRGLRISRIE